MDRLKDQKVLSEEKSGLIVGQDNRFRFGNKHELQMVSTLLVKKLLRDLRRVCVNGLDEL